MSQQRRITRDDLETQLRSLQGDVTDRVVDERKKIVTGAVATLVVLLVLTYLIGKRRGKRKTTIVEIRRV